MIPFCCTVCREWCGNGLRIGGCSYLLLGFRLCSSHWLWKTAKGFVPAFFGETLATASTCQLTVILPVAHGNNCNKFKQDLILLFKGNDGLGGL